MTSAEKAPALPPAVLAYLDRLRDLLPSSRADDVVAEVRALVEDRLEQDAEQPPGAEAAARALAALGPAEALASRVEGGGFTVASATRRTFLRTLAAVFAGHVMLSIVLSTIPGQPQMVPGLVGPLPRGSVLSTFAGLLGVFFTDAGFLLALFALLGRDRASRVLPTLRLRMPGTRRDAWLSLVLIALLVVVLHPLRDRIFAVSGSEGRTPIFSQEVVDLLPVADAVLFLFALRSVLLAIAGRERVESVIVDALAALAGAILAGLLLTRDALVQLPASLGKDQAFVLEDLLRRVFMVVVFFAGLALAIRLAKRCLRAKELLSG